MTDIGDGGDDLPLLNKELNFVNEASIEPNRLLSFFFLAKNEIYARSGLLQSSLQHFVLLGVMYRKQVSRYEPQIIEKDARNVKRSMHAIYL